MGDKQISKQHPATKPSGRQESDPLKARRQDALKLGKWLEKKKYARPADAQSLDDISDLLTKMGVGEKWIPVGTWIVKFHPLFGTDEEEKGGMVNVVTTRLQCITGLKNYEVKSLEELRLDDHLAGDRYHGEATGRSLFTKTKMKDTELNYEWAQTGTYNVGFEAVEDLETDCMGEMDVEYTTMYESITTMVEYERKSFEELRLEDYLFRLPRKKNAVGFNLHSSKNWYEDMKGISVNQKGSGLREFIPYMEHESNLCYEAMMADSITGQSHQDCREGTVQYHCITKMSDYHDKSFEELRLIDYLSGLRGPRGPMYKASEEELMRLKNIRIGVEVVIFIKTGMCELKEKGTIKYIGRVPENPFGKSYVGLELDRPVAQGDGIFRGIRLFQTKQGHAKIVPIESVLPASLLEGFDDDDDDMENEGEASSRQNLTGRNHDCVVCISRPVEIFFSPCGHVCCCEQCAQRLSDCPICRKRVSERKKVFLP